jgi:hypothetical protein
MVALPSKIVSVNFGIFSYQCSLSIFILAVTFMQGMYNYLHQTNHVSTAYSVAAVLYLRLQCLLHVMLFHTWNTFCTSILEGPGIDPRSLGIFSGASGSSTCPGVYTAAKNEYQDIPGGKDGRCVRVTTLPP